MKIDYLSYSTLKAWTGGCQRVVFEKKNNGVQKPFDSVFTIRGRAVHKALEEYYKAKKSDKKFTRSSFNSAVASIGVFDKEEQDDLFSMVEKYLEDRDYSHHEIIGTEVKFDIITPHGIPLFGYMDLVHADGKNLYVRDFKTDFMMREYNDQFLVYSVVMRELFPGYDNYYFVLDFINFEEVTLEVTQEVADANNETLASVFEAIQQAELSDLEYRPGQSCGSCPSDVMKSCRYYKEALKCKNVMTNDKSAVIDLLKEREKISISLKVLSTQKDNIDALLKLNLENNGPQTIDNYSIKFSTRKTASFDYMAMKKAFGNKVEGCASLTKTALFKILDKQEQAIAETMATYKISNSLSVKGAAGEDDE
jgi:hypothetical protein